METIYTAENVIFSFDKDLKEFNMQWIGFVKPEIFREAVDQIPMLAKKHGAEYLLNDTLRHKALAPQDAEYAAGKMPEIFAAGVSHFAFIMPEATLAKMAAQRFTNANNSTIQIGHFSSLEEARKWVYAEKWGQEIT